MFQFFVSLRNSFIFMNSAPKKNHQQLIQLNFLIPKCVFFMWLGKIRRKIVTLFKIHVDFKWIVIQFKNHLRTSGTSCEKNPCAAKSKVNGRIHRFLNDFGLLLFSTDTWIDFFTWKWTFKRNVDSNFVLSIILMLRNYCNAVKMYVNLCMHVAK